MANIFLFLFFNREEARDRNFAIWSARKSEEAKQEKQKREREEEEKKRSLNIIREKWASNERVVSYKDWKKKKEEERK